MVQRDTPAEEVAQILELQPTLVDPETTLDEVARAMLAHPRVHVVCVVNIEGRLLGILDLRTLADDLFFHIMPEEFLSEVTDLGDALRFAEQSGMRTVADAMKEPVWTKRGETVQAAFKRMPEHGLPGLPVVDDRYHVVGYIYLLELMAVCLDSGDSLNRAEEEA
jgi:CBS domain-containing protein